MSLSPFVLAANNDWLKDAFTKSHRPGDGEPYSINAEAKDLFDTQLDLIGTVGEIIDSGDGISKDDIVTADSIFVRLTRFMMLAVVVLSVPMVIFSAIKIMLSMGDRAKLMDALKQIAWVAAGIIIALMSVMIIYLVTSLTRSSL
jgi:hypothetical protein